MPICFSTQSYPTVPSSSVVYMLNRSAAPHPDDSTAAAKRLLRLGVPTAQELAPVLKRRRSERGPPGCGQ